MIQDFVLMFILHRMHYNGLSNMFSVSNQDRVLLSLHYPYNIVENVTLRTSNIKVVKKESFRK